MGSDRPQFAQTSQGQSHVSDISSPLSAKYDGITEGQCRRKTELLKGDTDQILVFVSPGLSYRHASSLVNSEAVVWFILRRRRRISRAVDTRSRSSPSPISDPFQ